MKRQQRNQKTYISVMISLIIICELLLKVDNMIIQSIGILLTPFIILCVLMTIKNDQKRGNN